MNMCLICSSYWLLCSVSDCSVRKLVWGKAPKIVRGNEPMVGVLPHSHGHHLKSISFIL